VHPIDEQSPQVRLRVALAGDREHDEAGELTVGLDRPQPRHEWRAVDHRRKQRVGERVDHRRHEILL